MNEHPPIIPSEETMPEPKSKAEKIADINDVYNEAITRHYSDKQDKESIADLEETIKGTTNRTIDTLQESDKAVFKKPQKQDDDSRNYMSGLKKLGVAIAMTLGIAGTAKGQNKEVKQIDKEGVKNEATVSSKSFELDEVTKNAWDEYRFWYKNYTQEHSIDHAFLQTTAGANQMIAEYKKETGKEITPEIVKKVQVFFNGYRAFILQAKDKGKVHINSSDGDFMASISKVDGIAGAHTMSLEIPVDHEHIITQDRMTGPEINGDHTVVVLNQHDRTEDVGYVNTAQYDDKGSK